MTRERAAELLSEFMVLDDPEMAEQWGGLAIDNLAIK